jgi:hypothetical protein
MCESLSLLDLRGQRACARPVRQIPRGERAAERSAPSQLYEFYVIRHARIEAMTLRAYFQMEDGIASMSKSCPRIHNLIVIWEKQDCIVLSSVDRV